MNYHALFFIVVRDKLTGIADHYLHPKMEGYIVKKGKIGACLWKEDTGKKFIEESNYENLELEKLEPQNGVIQIN